MGPNSGSGENQGVKVIFLVASVFLVMLVLTGFVLLDIGIVIAGLFGLLLTASGWGYEDRFRDVRVSVDWDSVKW